MFDDFKEDPLWQEGHHFKHHCKTVINIIGTTVALLLKPATLVSHMEYLGLKHSGLGISAHHYEHLGVEFIAALAQVQKEKFTPKCREAWLALYTEISRIMQNSVYPEYIAAEP